MDATRSHPVARTIGWYVLVCTVFYVGGFYFRMIQEAAEPLWSSMPWLKPAFLVLGTPSSAAGSVIAFCVRSFIWLTPTVILISCWPVSTPEARKRWSRAWAWYLAFVGLVTAVAAYDVYSIFR